MLLSLDLKWFSTNTSPHDFLFIIASCIYILSPCLNFTVVLNQALSKDWGFPDAYFLNCPKKCWSCIDPECECAMPPGFCKSNVPNSFEIDYVRIYQDKSDPRHVLGCSPPSRPTAEWIDGHKERYTLWEAPEGSKPIMEISRGGGVCSNNETTNVTTTTTTTWNVCGGEDRGVCDPVMGCLCRPGWTGPHCLSSYGDELIDMYEEFINSPSSPSTSESNTKLKSKDIIAISVVAAIAVTGLLVIGWVRWGKQSKGHAGYESIPNHENGNGSSGS
jgi:Beta-glucan synthesis-associated protein SKN1/KRE6/Sbg1